MNFPNFWYFYNIPQSIVETLKQINVIKNYRIFLTVKSLTQLICNIFSIDNTLYLEIHCPSVKPSLIVVSENGDNLVAFGKVPIGRFFTLSEEPVKC